MPRRLSAATAAAGAVFLVVNGPPSRALDSRTPVFRTEIGVVVLRATVTNAQGERVTDLESSAFAVYENGKSQVVTAFSREDAPVSLGIALDHSRSMTRARAEVQEAALALVGASNPRDEVFVLNFADKPSLDVPFTKDRRALEEGIGGAPCIGGTALRDALSAGQAYLTEHAAHERKALLLVSDGNDNASAASRGEVREQARRSAVVIYVIGLLDYENAGKAGRGREELDDLAGETGGLAYYPRSPEELLRAALDAARQIRSQYTIAYSPANQALDGSYRRIRVVAKGAGRLSVHTRTGYRAVGPEKQSPALHGSEETKR